MNRLHDAPSHHTDDDPPPGGVSARSPRSDQATRIVLAVHEAALAGCCEAVAFTRLPAWVSLVRSADLCGCGRPGTEDEAEALRELVRDGHGAACGGCSGAAPAYWRRLYLRWAGDSIAAHELAAQLEVDPRRVYEARERDREAGRRAA